MSRLLCCVCRPSATPAAPPDGPLSAMGAAISQPADRQPPTMAIVIRERKKKAGGAALGTLRRRIAAATRRPNNRPDRDCEHARFIRSIVANWRLAEVWLLCDQLEALNACRDLHTQAELAREPAPSLTAALAAARASRVAVDIEIQGPGYTIPAHAALLAARSKLFQRAYSKLPPNCRRITLQGPAAHLSLPEMEAALQALYSGTDTGGGGAGGGTTRSCAGSCYSGPVSALLGISPLAPHHHMRYLLESREYADTRLVWSNGQELPCHRFVLAARSRFFRGVVTRREGGAGGGAGGADSGGAVCVDDKVLPHRFARALLLAAYTDQVDLSLIGRPSSPTNSNGSSLPSSPWSSGARCTSASSQTLDDAFQLYEIARFLEMPIAVQGCEDAIVEALTHDTLPRVLAWAAHSHASQWVHRQAMRYLRDEFPSVMASAAGPLIPRAALSSALGSAFLQASEAQALRALIRWGSMQRPKHTHTEPNVVWHTAHSWTARGGGGGVAGGSRRRGGGREVADSALRDLLGPLLGLVRLEHLPPHTDVLQQAIRRGIIPEDLVGEGGGGAGAWLGRGVGRRPARCFLPYLDELRALLAEQQPPPELQRLRRAPQPPLAARIPDTLYMVAAARGTEAPVAEGEAACVSPRVLAALRARVRELRAAPTATRAASLPAADPHAIHTQIALRAVRERSLPDACADLLPAPDTPHAHSDTTDRAGSYESPVESGRAELCPPSPSLTPSQSPSPSPSPGASTTNIPKDSSRSSSAGTCRRDQHRSSSAEWSRGLGSGGGGGGSSLGPGSGVGVGVGEGGGGGRLSARVPDVAMGPNANTHLLTHRDYHPHPLAHRHPRPEPHPHHHPLQLDLGDGATHAPAPGSRALRAHVRHRDYNQNACLFDRLERERAESRDDRSEDELRAAIELSVIRAYSGMGWEHASEGSVRRPAPAPSHTLPHCTVGRGEGNTYGANVSTPLRVSPAPLPHAAPPPFAPLRASNDDVVSLSVSPRSRRPPHTPRAPYRAPLQYRLDTSGALGGVAYTERGSSEERRSPRPPPSPRDYA